jgi:CDP-diacylglycerol--glycerol-3-phosphate 3-phosphatidyltransferase
MVLTVPNLITLARLGSLPVFLILTYSQVLSGLIAAWVLFNLAAASDWLDGFLARRSGSVSRLGTLLDPVVDKVIILSTLFALVDLRLLPLWIVLLAMAREFMVSAARHAATTPTRVVGANWMGKAKFALQVAVIELGYLVLLLRLLGRPAAWGQAALFWSALGVTVLSYLFLARFVRATAGKA